MPKLTIDGKEVEVEAGTTVIRAAADAGINIPYYCWHPRLSVAANCRMCLVEVENAPKLLPSCEAVCRDGMVVNTTSQKVKEARESVMEFMLINHPIDCPICDQAGECKLQNYYMEFDQSGTRFNETKVVKRKTVELGPSIMLDEERCINCTRCVRFMDEVAGNPQLGQFERGDRAIIGVFPGTELDDPYSGNVADICPVGALTNRDFRFKKRAWFLQHTESVCPGCARGCSTRIDHENNRIYRLKPRDNEWVNKGWLCDEGRLTYHEIHDEETVITAPHARDTEGEFHPVDWALTRQTLAEQLGQYVGESDGKLGLALSAQLTTEGATSFIELAEQILQVDTYAILASSDGEEDELLRVADKNPNRAGCELVLEAYSIYDEGSEALKKAIHSGAVEHLVMVGGDYANVDEDWLSALDKLKTLIVFATNWNDTARKASLVVPMASYAEQDGTFVNFTGRMQRINRALKPLGGRKTPIELATMLAAALDQTQAWSVTSWTSAFAALRERTNLLENISPLKLGQWGTNIGEATEQSEGVSRSQLTDDGHNKPSLKVVQ
ncbi:MAG: 2Fe-2S iron-sulfur cluster-binding protein [Myxococcota bacterium]|nr:2Fe-2S iron-sulfur cluster-binding protein [Myxococcota bacterium]